MQSTGCLAVLESNLSEAVFLNNKTSYILKKYCEKNQGNLTGEMLEEMRIWVKPSTT